MRLVLVTLLLGGVLVAACSASAFAPRSDADAGGATDASALASPEAAGNDASPRTSPTFVTDDDALDGDLAAIAEAQGWTQEQARAYERAEAALDEVVTRLESERPGRYVSARLADDPLDPPTLSITGRRDPWLDGVIAATGVEIVVIDGEPFSFEELDERQTRVHTTFVEAGFTQLVTASDFDSAGGITVTIGESPDPAAVAAVLAALPPELAASVTVITTDGPVLRPLTPP